MNMRDETGAKGLADLCCYAREKRGKNLLVVEVGSCQGESSMIFALHFARVVCIDTWDYAGSYIQEPKPGAIERAFDSVARFFPSTIIKRKGSSLEVAATWQEEIDLLYIDADHDYQAVKADLLAWHAFMAPNGFICGHDYENPDHPGVAEAVLELLGEPDKVFQDRSWLKQAWRPL